MIEWLAGWNNWPFLFTFLVGMGLVLVTLIGGTHHGEGDVHLDHDLDHPGSFGKEVGHGTLEALAFLGVGKAPLMILMESMLISFGLIGLTVNALGRDLLGSSGPMLFPVSLVAALVGSVVLTRGVAGFVMRWAPPDGATKRISGEFVGLTGTSETLVTAAIGQALIDSGVETQPRRLLNVYLDADWPTDIPRGTEVVIVSYDPARSMYRVRPLSIE